MRKDKDLNVCTFNKDGKCSILSAKNCKGCSFFKTDQEYYESRATAWLRLTSLPEKVRAKIQHKYYRRDDEKRKMKLCPNCGAKMTGSAENATDINVGNKSEWTALRIQNVGITASVAPGDNPKEGLYGNELQMGG